MPAPNDKTYLENPEGDAYNSIKSADLIDTPFKSYLLSCIVVPKTLAANYFTKKMITRTD